MASEEMHTFIIRLSQDTDGRLRGILERVRTGEKLPVRDVATLGQLVRRMLGADERDHIHRPADP